MSSATATLNRRDAVAPQTSSSVSTRSSALGIVRILLGFVFLWSFLDKTFGLYATSSQEAWVAGHSPTAGYLSGVEGPFGAVFQAMSGQAWVDWTFMAGMGLVGTALILGVGMRLAAAGAVALMGSLYLTSLPLENNPVVDEHLLYAVLAVALAAVRAGHSLGLGGVWESLPAVRRTPWLQ